MLDIGISYFLQISYKNVRNLSIHPDEHLKPFDLFRRAFVFLGTSLLIDTFYMSCYVYFLYSVKWTKFYVGISNDIDDRLKRHNKGQRLSTKGGLPWELVHVITCEDKSVAMLLEIKIKKRGIGRFLADNNIFPGL